MCQICWCIQGNVLKKTLPDSLRPPQIQHVVAWYRTRPVGVRGQRLAPGIDSENKDLRFLHFNATKMCWAVRPRSFLAELGEKSADSCHSCSHQESTQNFLCGRGLTVRLHVAHLRHECHNSKFVIFQEKLLQVLKYHNFLWVQRRHNCSPATSYVNCVMTPYLLKVHLQTFPPTPINKNCQILSCDTLAANERYNLCLILRTVLQNSCHQYNCNLTRFSTAFTNI